MVGLSQSRRRRFRQFPGFCDKRFEGVSIVIVVDPLQHSRDAFQPHPRINAWARQIDARFRIQLLILHEHKIPDFHESVATRSEEHTSELQTLNRISYAVFCLKKKTTTKT